MTRLHRAKVPARVLLRLVLSLRFAGNRADPRSGPGDCSNGPTPSSMGLAPLLEEGTEIVAMLIFVATTHPNSVSLLRASQDVLVAPVRRRRLIAFTAALLWAPLTAATFVLRDPGGPADWLAASLFLICALLATRTVVLRGKIDARSATLILFYVAASAAANAVSFEWTPVLLGVMVSVRGAWFAILLDRRRRDSPGKSATRERAARLDERRRHCGQRVRVAGIAASLVRTAASVCVVALCYREQGRRGARLHSRGRKRRDAALHDPVVASRS